MKHPARKATPLTIALLLAPLAPPGYANTLLTQPATNTTTNLNAVRAIPWSDPDLEAALVGVPTKAQADRILALAKQHAQDAPRWINDLRERIDQLDAQDDTQNAPTREAEQAALTLDLVAPLAAAQADLIIALLDHTSPRDDRIARIRSAIRAATAVEPLNTWSTIERGTLIGIASANLGELTDDNLTHWRTAALAARDQPDDPRGWILRAVPVINANALSDAPGVNDGLNLLKGKSPKRAESLRLRLTPIQDRIALLWDQRATDPDALSRIAATAPLSGHTTRAAAAQRYATIIVSNPEDLEPLDPPPGASMQGLEDAIEALRLTAAINAAQDAIALERLVDRAVTLNDPTIAYQLLTKLTSLNPSAHDASLRLGVLLANASVGDTRTAWTQHALAAGVALFSANPSPTRAIKLADHALALTPKGATPTPTDTALLASITWAAQSNPTALVRLSDILTHYTPGDLRQWRIADHALRRWRNTPASTLLNADPADDPFWAALAAWSDAGLLITQGDGVAATQRLRDTNTLNRLPELVEPNLEHLQDAIPNLMRAAPKTKR